MTYRFQTQPSGSHQSWQQKTIGRLVTALQLTFAM